MGDIHSARNKRRTICEVHQEIFRELSSRGNESELLALVQEAFDMAKKMNNKLIQYKEGYDDGWWKKNKFEGGELSG